VEYRDPNNALKLNKAMGLPARDLVALSTYQNRKPQGSTVKDLEIKNSIDTAGGTDINNSIEDKSST
jgi:hypothetical protein